MKSHRAFKSAFPRLLLLVLGLLALFGPFPMRAAERFGDIAITPQNTFSGITRHGYYEHQILVANESSKRSHEVTLVFPSASVSPPGFYLRAMRRSLTVAPNSSVLFKMWQPPFPTLDKHYAVYVDGDYEGVVTLGSYNDHGRNNFGMTHAPPAQSLLTSRQVNSEQVRSLLSDVAGTAFSATKATGPPDSQGRPTEAWKPSPRRGTAEWLEVNFDPPFPAQQVIFHESEHHGAVDRIQLLSPDGRVLHETNSFSRPLSSSSQCEAVFPLTSEPVARVKLILNPYVRGTVPGIDAVQLAGPDQRAWAANARASSSMAAPAVMAGPRSAVYRSASLSPQLEIIRSELEPAQWSDHWLSYTPFEVILITPQDYEAMPEPVRGALWGYVRCGGRLAVFGAIPIPSPWQKLGKREENATTYPVGFGLCQLIEISSLDKAVPSELQGLSRLLNPATHFFEGSGGAGSDIHPYPFQVIEEVRIPFRGLAMILLGFVTLAGPLNLWLLARYQRKIWSLWTIPAISLLTCGLVSLYAILGEGITPRLRLEGLTLLDQREHLAATLGMAGYYCPLTPSDGLRFDYHSELQWVTDGPSLRERKLVEVDWTQGQHLSRGWVPPRVPTYFQIRKFQSRRERVHLERDNQGRLAVINGLGAPVAALRLTHLDGRSFAATNLAPGQRLLLTPSSSGQTEAFSTVAPPWSGDSFGLLHRLRRANYVAPSEFVWEELKSWSPPPGVYLALLEGAPFLEEGLRQKALRKKAQVVVGLMDASDLAP